MEGTKFLRRLGDIIGEVVSNPLADSIFLSTEKGMQKLREKSGLSHMDLSGGMFSATKFERVKLKNTNFSNADLCGVNLSGAEMQHIKEEANS